jgi:hypothetical protein
MSVIKTATVKNITATLPDGTQQVGNVLFKAIKVENDDDAKELLELYASDVAIINTLRVGENNYVFIKSFEPKKKKFGKR